jgi:hypothetical protein
MVVSENGAVEGASRFGSQRSASMISRVDLLGFPSGTIPRDVARSGAPLTNQAIKTPVEHSPCEGYSLLAWTFNCRHSR